MDKLRVEGVCHQFDGSPILDDISLQIGENEIVCLLGMSGAGKTTLFHIISGLLRPSAGKVVLDGEEITGTSGHISYMLQKDLLFPFRTVLDNVALPLQIRGESKKAARERAAVHFEEFGLSGYEKKYPAQLSGGMRQRAALMRTYLFSEGVALLDEPFSALDAITKGSMHQWYLNMMERISLSTLFITHDIDEAVFLSDRIYILSGRPGRITREIRVNEPRPRAADFGLSESFLTYKREVSLALREGQENIQL